MLESTLAFIIIGFCVLIFIFGTFIAWSDPEEFDWGTFIGVGALAAFILFGFVDFT